MKPIMLAAAAALSLVAPSVGNAAVNITGVSFAPPGTRDGVLHLPTSFVDNTSQSFGEFKLTGTDTVTSAPVTLYTYCVDLFHGLFAPSTFTVQSLTPYFSAAKATNITKLLANTTATNADTSAAIQLAMWEIVYDNPPSFNVNSGAGQGNFYVTAGNSSTARTLANTYLANLSTWTVPTGGTAYLLYNERNQSQVYYAMTPVPEAATWGMMIVGFGVVGASLRRRGQVSYRLA